MGVRGVIEERSGSGLSRKESRLWIEEKKPSQIGRTSELTIESTIEITIELAIAIQGSIRWETEEETKIDSVDIENEIKNEVEIAEYRQSGRSRRKGCAQSIGIELERVEAK